MPSRRVSFSDPDPRPPSPVIINLGEIRFRSGSARTTQRVGAANVSRIATSSQGALTEMTATLAVRERALELTEERYAAAVRKSQELEKEIMQLKAGLNDARWARAQLEIPPRPVFSFSPVSPPAYSSFSTNPVTVWPNDRRSSPQHGTYGTYGTVYVDVDFMVDATGRVTPLNVRPRL